MQVKTVSIDSISQDPANLRRHGERNLASIVASLRKFGQQHPIVVTDQGVILSGNGRYQAAKQLGWKEIAVTVTSLKGSDATAYAIADNRTAELAEWDDTALAETLRALQSEDYEIEAAGYTESEIDGLIKGLADDLLGKTEVVEDEVPEPPADPIAKPGDLWILGEHRLLCGDSTKAEDVARLMDGANADLCFTSPPYNLGKSVGLRNGARKGAGSAYNNMDDCGQEWPAMMRRFIRQAILVSNKCAINVQLLSGNKADLLQLIGEYACNTIDVAVWVKSNPQPAMADGVMTSAFEFIWLLCQEENPSRKINGASFQRGTFSNVFNHATASGHDASVHGAVFPLAVASHFIQSLSGGNALIYEPFCGSGTTLIAAEQLGRKCYGMEISPQYCDVIVKRWEQLTGMVAVRETPVGTPD